jgi:hypothetical protein
MQCPGCQYEVSGCHFYCPECRTQLLRTTGLSLTAQEIAKIEPPGAPPSRALPAILMAVTIGGLATGVVLTVTNISDQSAAGHQGLAQNSSVLTESSVLAESFVNRPAMRRTVSIGSGQQTEEMAAAPLTSAAARSESQKPAAKTELDNQGVKPDLALAARNAASPAAATELVKDEIKVAPFDSTLDPQMGLLTIKSHAPARIYINGQFSGTTPRAVRLLAGEHTVSLSADGYEEWLRKIPLRGRQQVTVSASMNKKIVSR